MEGYIASICVNNRRRSTVPFETFTNKGMQVVRGPMYLSISKEGFAYLNTDTSRALGDEEYVTFLFDHDTGQLGFRTVPEGTSGAYKLTRVGPGRSCTMRKVLDHYGFVVSDIKGKHRVFQSDEDQGVYVIDLYDQLPAAEEEVDLSGATETPATTTTGDDDFTPSNEPVAATEQDQETAEARRRLAAREYLDEHTRVPELEELNPLPAELRPSDAALEEQTQAAFEEAPAAEAPSEQVVMVPVPKRRRKATPAEAAPVEVAPAPVPVAKKVTVNAVPKPKDRKRSRVKAEAAVA
jgi:hypothetical protein